MLGVLFQHLQIFVQALTDGAKPELLGMNVFGREPHAGGGIVHGREGLFVFHFAAEEKIERLHLHAGVKIDVGLTEEVATGGDGEPSLFFHLALHALFGRLSKVGKATGKIECALGGLVFPPLYEQFSFLVDNESDVGTAGIEKVFKSTVSAFFALFGASLEVCTAARGAVTEFF